MAQKPNKPDREQNRIKIYMNIGQITDSKTVEKQCDTSHSTQGSPPILETLIQVFLYGQASDGTILHRNQLYSVQNPELSRNSIDQKVVNQSG